MTDLNKLHADLHDDIAHYIFNKCKDASIEHDLTDAEGFILLSRLITSITRNLVYQCANAIDEKEPREEFVADISLNLIMRLKSDFDHLKRTKENH